MNVFKKNFTESFFDSSKLQTDPIVQQLLAEAEGELNQMKQTRNTFANKNKLSKWLKKGIFILMGVLFVWVGTLAILFPWEVEGTGNPAIAIVIWGIMILLWFWINPIPLESVRQLKQKHLNKYLSKIFKWLKFVDQLEFEDFTLAEFNAKSDLLKPFDGIYLEDDFLIRKHPLADIKGKYINTYTITRDKDWKPTRHQADNAYIFWLKVKKHKFPFKSRIKLLPDINDKPFLKFLLALGVIILVHIFGWGMGLAFGGNYIHLNTQSGILAIAIWEWLIFALSLWFLNLIFEQKRVTVEDVNFENLFDVRAEDEVEARRLLTPNFMEKLANFVKQNPYKRWHFAFVGDEIFVKVDMPTIPLWELALFNKKPKQTLEKFFARMKSILSFVDNLNLEYFSGIAADTK